MKKYVNNSFINKSPLEYKNGTKAVTSLPVEIFTDGQPVTSWTMKGNTSTSGTPSPSNPITINGVGEKTANLLDESDVTYDGTRNVSYLTNNPYHLDANEEITVSLNHECTAIYIVNASNDINLKLEQNTDTVTYTRTSALNIYIKLRFDSGVPQDLKVMLNEGSRALPYEPYGKYKISISSNQTALTPVYLTEPLMLISTYADSLASSGTVTRVVKKLVFNGTETFDKNIVDANDYLYWLRVSDSGQTNRTVCSHLLYSATIPTGGTIGTSSRINTHVLYLNFGADIMNAQTSGNTKEGFKEYLAAQYAAGTPVTVYYVLETPTTESVTAPTITTTGGTATIDVDTTIKPSELDLTYHGWHSHEPLKRENGSWS